MSRHHDKWYTRPFSHPRIVEELLRSFVHEEFVNEIDFSSIIGSGVKKGWFGNSPIDY